MDFTSTMREIGQAVGASIAYMCEPRDTDTMIQTQKVADQLWAGGEDEENACVCDRIPEDVKQKTWSFRLDGVRPSQIRTEKWITAVQAAMRLRKDDATKSCGADKSYDYDQSTRSCSNMSDNEHFDVGSETDSMQPSPKVPVSSIRRPGRCLTGRSSGVVEEKPRKSCQDVGKYADLLPGSSLRDRLISRGKKIPRDIKIP